MANIISGKGNVPTPESDVSVQPVLDATVGKLSPRAQANIGAVFNTAMAIGTAKGIDEAAGGVKAGVKNYKAGGLPPEVRAGKVAGQITQGDLADIPASKNALSKVDPSKVKTYKDLHTELDTHVKNLSEAKGKVLETNTAQIKLPDLKAKVGNTTHNFVNDALTQLETYYTKTNDIAGKSEIKALRAKAEGQGLTVKEIDDLAVRHGQDLNGYNANGELASGLSKQAAENTRAGLKTTARDIFNHDAYKAADTELSHTIRTRDLVKQMSEKVNELQQKIQKRGIGERIGRAVGRGMNFATGGGLKGFVEHFIGRGTGLKTLNALDLEAALQKNLKLLQEASRPGASEATIISKLKQIVETPPTPKGGMNYQTVEPQKLEYFKPNTKKLVKVNNYQNPDFSKYITPDQVNRATKVLTYKENAGRPIDMAAKAVKKKITPMNDIKPPASPIRYEPVNLPKPLNARILRYSKNAAKRPR